MAECSQFCLRFLLSKFKKKPITLLFWGEGGRVKGQQTTFDPAKNHPWVLTTLGCPGTPDLRNSSVDNFLSRGVSTPSNHWAETDLPCRHRPRRDSWAQEFIDWGIPRVRGSWACKGGEHPRVVFGWPNYWRFLIIRVPLWLCALVNHIHQQVPLKCIYIVKSCRCTCAAVLVVTGNWTNLNHRQFQTPSPHWGPLPPPKFTEVYFFAQFP